MNIKTIVEKKIHYLFFKSSVRKAVKPGQTVTKIDERILYIIEDNVINVNKPRKKTNKLKKFFSLHVRCRKKTDKFMGIPHGESRFKCPKTPCALVLKPILNSK